jgi:diphosphate-dependent phosphofructokinase
MLTNPSADVSLLQKIRQTYLPPRPLLLSSLHEISFSKEEIEHGEREIQKLFPKSFGMPLVKARKSVHKRQARPKRIGVVFSGGQAAGGHNVIAGLFDALKELHPESRCFGFLNGPSGIIEGKSREITKEHLVSFRNTGGFDFLGSGRTKIATEEQLAATRATVCELELDGLVIIGGDDSNTTAAILAEYFLAHACPAGIIGVPKTIDGDLQNPYVAISFGFDTACKVYSELIGNIARDALSAKKYTHFIKLMGRSASHITLECALQNHPNLALIGEEIAARKKTLAQVVQEVADLIAQRSERGRDYGIILIPEGLIEFFPEIERLLDELNHLPSLSREEILQKLTPSSSSCLQALPETIQKQLLLERDPHGNIQLSLIETERLLIEKVSEELKSRKKRGTFKGKFAPQSHFFGYEGRSGFPSNFDANYCYALGMASALLIDEGLTGYMGFVLNLKETPSQWHVGGVPLTSLLHLEKRGGVLQPVIRKALVDLKGKPFQLFCKEREKWAREDAFLFPGPMQFFGPPELTESVPRILA